MPRMTWPQLQHLLAFISRMVIMGRPPREARTAAASSSVTLKETEEPMSEK